MIASWIAYTALVTGLLAVVGVALERVSTARGWPRRTAWIAVMSASLAWPVFGAARSLVPRAEPVLPFTITLPTQVIVAGESGLDRAVLIDRALAVLWCAGTLLLLLRLTGSVLRLRRTRRDWRRGEIDGTAVCLSPNVGPAVVGLRSMEVVLPEWIVSLDAPLRAIVLCHEEEHRRARDPYLLCGAAIAVALMPWNVALWFQARRLRLAIEMDCDARVLRAHPSAERYGLLMLTIAQRRSVVPGLFAAMLSEPTSNLERRILAMRTTTRRLARASGYGAAMVALGVFAFACSLQSENPLAPRAETSKTSKEPAYFEFSVAKQAAPLPGNPAPRYPDLLRQAQIEGEVLAQFVVNADSTVDMRTFKVLETTHDLFTASVRNALAQMRWSPAMTGNTTVRQLMQMPFSFSLSPSTGARANAGAAVVPGTNRSTAGAQVRAPARGLGEPKRVSESGVYFEYQVERQVSPRPGNASPRYPDELRAQGAEGEVLAQFVVDTDGMVDTTTFKALKSTHDLFTNTVRDALPRMRFFAADVGGKAVKQLVQMPFQFSLSK